MAKKLAKITLPRAEKALDALAAGILAYAGPRIEGLGEQPPEWTDIPLAFWTAFKSAYAAWTLAYEACKIPHVPAVTEAKDGAKADLCNALDQLTGHGLTADPRKAEDVIAMGFPLRDSTRSPIGTPKTVPLIVSLTARRGQQVLVHFKDELSEKSEAVPYGMSGCILNFCYGPEKVMDKALIKDRLLMTSSPYLLAKLPPEAQNTWLSCYVQWQNESGEEGKGGDVSTVVVL
jgi:hypothetical protein